MALLPDKDLFLAHPLLLIPQLILSRRAGFTQCPKNSPHSHIYHILTTFDHICKNEFSICVDTVSTLREVLIKFLQSIYSRPLPGLQVAQSWREPKYLFRPPTQQQIFSFENICAIISKKMPSLAKECNLQ